MYNYHITKTTQFHIINIRIGDVIVIITKMTVNIRTLAK